MITPRTRRKTVLSLVICLKKPLGNLSVFEQKKSATAVHMVLPHSCRQLDYNAEDYGTREENPEKLERLVGAFGKVAKDEPAKSLISYSRTPRGRTKSV